MPTLRSRSTASSMVSRFSDEVKNQRGYWSRIEPELAGLGERLEPVGEPRPDVVLERRRAGPWRRSALFSATSPGRASRRSFGQPLRLGRLTGHQRVGLDVEREVGRRALDPQLRRPADRQRVVRRVDLDEREARRVELEPLLGAVGAGRVEDARRGHRRVGPGRRADADRAAVLGRERFRGDVRRAVEGRRRGVGTGVVDVRHGHPDSLLVTYDRAMTDRPSRTARTCRSTSPTTRSSPSSSAPS